MSKMDNSIEKEIKNLEQRLDKMKKGDPEVVFKCPKCDKSYEQLGNYRELKMCSKCFVEVKTRELKEHVEHILGGTVLALVLSEADPYSPDAEPQIVNITVKTKDGSIVNIKKKKNVTYIL